MAGTSGARGEQPSRMLKKARLLTRPALAGEKSDFFSILFEIPVTGL